MAAESEGQGMGTDDRMERLEARLDAQQRQIDALLGENERLRARVQPSAPAPGRRPDDARPDDARLDDARQDAAPPGLDRRRLLLGGATAGVAAAAAIVGTATPAAAANGNPLTLGQSNTSTATTSLDATVADGNTAVAVALTGSGAAIEGTVSGNGFGVRGIGGTGVDGAGVFGSGTTSVGVWGASTSESGVYGESSSNTGLFGVSGTGGGAYGISNSGLGIYGQSVSNVAVRGLSVNSIGLDGIGGTIGVSAVGPQSNLYLPADAGTRAAPTSDAITHERGEVLTDASGNQWVCVTSGTPGTWRKTAGPATAGQLHVLAAPVRIYDSRAGSSPSQGPKTKFAGNETRTFDLKVNSSGVPAGATAALVTLLLVNAAAADGNLTIWANGVARPSANTLVWGGSAGRFTATAVTALDSLARVQVNASQTTNLVIDVVGYYR